MKILRKISDSVLSADTPLGPILENLSRVGLKKIDHLELSSDEIDRLFELAKKNRVSSQVADNLRGFQSASKRVRGIILHAVKFDLVVRNTLRLVTQEISNQTLDLMAIKGVSLIPYYSSFGSIRQMYDVDIMAANMQEGWKALAYLKDAEASLKLICVRRLLSCDSVVGGEAYNLGRYGLPGRYPIDLHLGCFPIVAGQFLNSPLWERKRTKQIHDLVIYTPSPEDMLLITVAHIYHHATVRLRDVNDAFVVLEKHRDDFDWDYFNSECKKNHLGPIAFALFNAVEKQYGFDFVPVDITSALRPRVFEQWALKYFWDYEESRLTTGSVLLALQASPTAFRQLGVIRGSIETLLGIMYEAESQIRIRQLGTLLTQTLGLALRCISSLVEGRLTRFRYLRLGLIYPQDGDHKGWGGEIDLDKLQRVAKCLELTIEPMDDRMVVWKYKGIRFVITPVGIFAEHTKYSVPHFQLPIDKMRQNCRPIYKLIADCAL